MKVQYLCKCLVQDVEIDVPARKPDEPIEFWMNNCLTPALYLDHRRRSPKCDAEVMTWVKVPIFEDRGVGEEMKPN